MIPPKTQHEIRNGFAIIQSGMKHIEKAIRPDSSEIISPLGHWRLRMDTEGSGKFGAKRAGSYHLAIDIEDKPGAELVSPCDAKILRYFNVYENNPKYTGMELLANSGRLIIQLRYVLPFEGLAPDLSQGQLIGSLDDIRERYSHKMKAHLDFRIMINPLIFGGNNV